jgi:hypothetical protein
MSMALHVKLLLQGLRLLLRGIQAVQICLLHRLHALLRFDQRAIRHQTRVKRAMAVSAQKDTLLQFIAQLGPAFLFVNDS